MHTNQKLHISSTSLEQSLAPGRKLGQAAQSGQLNEQVGTLGGGKTVIAKGIAQGLGITQTITSPTFSVQRSYAIPGGGYLEHFDLYRLEDVDIIEQSIKEILADKTNIVLIEWSKPFIEKLRSDRLIITIQWVNEDTRDITINATGPVSTRALADIA